MTAVVEASGPKLVPERLSSSPTGMIDDSDSAGATIVRYMSDYKAVSGVKFPHKMKVEAGQTIEISVTSIKINEKIDDKIFAYPGE